MRIPGPRTTVKLQYLTDSQSGTGEITETWTDACQAFGAVVAKLTSEEKARFDKETAMAEYRIFIDYADIGAAKETYVSTKNRINVPTGDMVIPSGNYDIIRVVPYQKAGHKHYEVYLYKEEV